MILELNLREEDPHPMSFTPRMVGRVPPSHSWEKEIWDEVEPRWHPSLPDSWTRRQTATFVDLKESEKDAQ